MYWKRTIKKHLASRDQILYSPFERILEMHLRGEIKKRLSCYDDVWIRPSVNNTYKSIQMEYSFQNMVAAIEFSEDKYTTAVYYRGISIEELDTVFVDYDYSDNFTLNGLIEQLDYEMQVHPKRKDISAAQQEIKRLKRISASFAAVTYITVAVVILYVLISGNSLYLSPWNALIAVVPLVISSILNKKIRKITIYSI